MATLLKELKDSIYTNGKVNIAAVLFTIADPIGFIGIYIAFKHAEECAKTPDIFQDSNFYLTLFLTIAYSLRVPYMWDKPLARVLLFLNIFGWGYVAFLYLQVYLRTGGKNEKDKTSTRKTNKE